jgi:hypothetical protein
MEEVFLHCLCLHLSYAGKGEYFVRSVCAYDVSARMQYGNSSLQQAAHDTVHNGVRRAVVPEGEPLVSCFFVCLCACVSVSLNV